MPASSAKKLAKHNARLADLELWGLCVPDPNDRPSVNDMHRRYKEYALVIDKMRRFSTRIVLPKNSPILQVMTEEGAIDLHTQLCVFEDGGNRDIVTKQIGIAIAEVNKRWQVFSGAVNPSSKYVSKAQESFEKHVPDEGTWEEFQCFALHRLKDAPVLCAGVTVVDRYRCIRVTIRSCLSQAALDDLTQRLLAIHAAQIDVSKRFAKDYTIIPTLVLIPPITSKFIGRGGESINAMLASMPLPKGKQVYPSVMPCRYGLMMIQLVTVPRAEAARLNMSETLTYRKTVSAAVSKAWGELAPLL